MPTLTIEGRDVQVSDKFLTLSPEEQNRTVDEIATQMGIQGSRSTSGLPDDVNPDVLSGNPKYASDLRAGLQKKADTMLVGPSSVGNEAATGLINAANTIGLNIPRNVAAGIATGLGKMGIEGYAPTFSQNYQRAQDIEAALNRQNSKSGVAGTVAGVGLGAAALPGLSGATTITGRAAQAGGTAGLYSAGSELADSKDPVRAAKAGGMGFVLGAGASPLIESAARVAGNGGLARAIGRGTARGAVGDALDGVAPQTIDAAETLMQDAAQRGVRLTWDEAIQQVTGGATRLGDLRRVVENSRGGGDVMKPLMAERRGQVQAAGQQALGDIAQQPLDPVRTGLGAQRAAEGEIGGAQQAINEVTRPYYQRSQQQRVGNQIHQGLLDDPLYERTLQEVRNNPALNRGIENLPDDNVAVIDLVQRRMREAADNARMPGQANSSNLIAANLEDARRAPLEAAERVTGGRYGDYATARDMQQTLRQNVLEPLNEGPVGQISRTGNVRTQGEALLPSVSAPGSENIVAEAVHRLARRDLQATESLIHSHIRAAFDEATQNLPGGANQFGGAKFAAVIAGNGQQARNLEAAIRALPHGDQRWQGFRRFLDIMEATGQRPQQGSATAFNQEIIKQLKQGSLATEAATAVKTSGTSLIKRVTEFMDQVNLGRNTGQIARILVDPRSAQFLRQLAVAPRRGTQASALAVRLIGVGAGLTTARTHA
ncbi:MAG: hypothetical protein U1E62_11945 [Alsobacter sp.]